MCLPHRWAALRDEPREAPGFCYANVNDALGGQIVALQAGQDKAGLAARKKVFEAEFADWIATQNARVDAHGIPSEDLRPW